MAKTTKKSVKKADIVIEFNKDGSLGDIMVAGTFLSEGYLLDAVFASLPEKEFESLILVAYQKRLERLLEERQELTERIDTVSDVFRSLEAKELDGKLVTRCIIRKY